MQKNIPGSIFTYNMYECISISKEIKKNFNSPRDVKIIYWYTFVFYLQLTYINDISLAFYFFYFVFFKNHNHLSLSLSLGLSIYIYIIYILYLFKTQIIPFIFFPFKNHHHQNDPVVILDRNLYHFYLNVHS